MLHRGLRLTGGKSDIDVQRAGLAGMPLREALAPTAQHMGRRVPVGTDLLAQ